MFLELIFRDNFLPHAHFRKSSEDENYSGTFPPTSPNDSKIQDAAVNSVHRCTMCTFYAKGK